MKFGLLQCTGKVGDNADTNHEIGDMICVANFHDLCQRQSRKVGEMEFGPAKMTASNAAPTPAAVV